MAKQKAKQIEDIFKLDTLPQLTTYLRKLNHDTARELLLTDFEQSVDYRNARDWNRLVRLCEALALVGWGDAEAVEAICEKWYDGSYCTRLANRFFEERFRPDSWRKQGATFILDDHGQPGVDRRDYGVAKLLSQRNLLPKNPVRLAQMTANMYPEFKPLYNELAKLRNKLDRQTRPELYGDGFGYLGVVIDFSDKWSDYFHSKKEIPKGFKGNPFVRDRIDLGKLSKKQGELRLVATRHFPHAFTQLSIAQQKAEFRQDLLEMLDALAQRLAKKKINYDTPLLIADVTKILSKWVGKSK
jgi:hypothetical protein